jgi:hypothetical protein
MKADAKKKGKKKGKGEKPAFMEDKDKDKGADADAAKGADAPKADKVKGASNGKDGKAVKSLTKQVKELTGLVEKMSHEEVRGGVAINGAGLAAGGRPLLRAIDGGLASPRDAFKAFDDAIADAQERAAKGEHSARVEVDALRMQKATAMMIANERAIRQNPGLRDPRFRDDATKVFTNRRELPDDPTIQGWGGARGGGVRTLGIG